MGADVELDVLTDVEPGVPPDAPDVILVTERWDLQEQVWVVDADLQVFFHEVFYIGATHPCTHSSITTGS